jgi:hypothetical protein
MCYNVRKLYSFFIFFIEARQTKCVLIAGAFALAVPLAALANGIRENGSWQFETVAERTQKAAVLDLIEKKNAGTYNNTFNTTNNTNYNISGDYVDCNMTSTSLGNQGTVTQDAPVASPTIGVSSSTSSSSSGNSGSGTVTAGSDSSSPGLSENGSTINSSTAGGANSVSTTQSNNGSSQNSAATGNTFASKVSGITGSGGGASVALNSSQSLAGSSVSSNIANSSACRFNTATGNNGSPINSQGSK